MPTLKSNTIIPSALEDESIAQGIASDPNAREWQDQDFADAKPAREVLSQHLNPEVAAALLAQRGRPKALNPKVHLNLRLDSDIVNTFKSSGRGWQTRINDILKEWVHKHTL
ncbi:MAG: BrnA antitoxin family protein [Burkholderiaceae bacterium]|nr:BrnA antitoxin family protein [Burkholderiaceae bacterium]